MRTTYEIWTGLCEVAHDVAFGPRLNWVVSRLAGTFPVSVAVTVFGREHKPAGSRTIEKARPFLRVPKFGFKVVFEVLYASVNKNVCEKKLFCQFLRLCLKYYSIGGALNMVACDRRSATSRTE